MGEEAADPEAQMEFPPEGPAQERRAGDLVGEEEWASVIGTVISRDPGDSSFVVDDGSGQLTVKAPALPELGGMVRVVGRTLLREDGPLLDATVVQDFSDFDVELYRKVVELEERVFSRDADYRQ
jgi:hypothetical protein